MEEVFELPVLDGKKPPEPDGIVDGEEAGPEG